MGILISAGTKTSTYIGKDGKTHKQEGYFKNKNATENLIRYVTRTRPGESRLNELMLYGVLGAADYAPIEVVINQFITVQYLYPREVCRHMYHFVYCPEDIELKFLYQNPSLAARIALDQASFFYNLGHQIVYAIHDDPEKRLHIHYAVNAVNFRDFHMFHYNLTKVKRYNTLFTKISMNRIADTYNMVYPILMPEDLGYDYLDSINCDDIVYEYEEELGLGEDPSYQQCAELGLEGLIPRWERPMHP